MPIRQDDPAATGPGRNLALALATVAFAVNFWAWSLLSPLAPRYQELLGLSPLAVSVMVAVPVIVGSLGRIPLGALTDRYGGRIVFALLSFVTIVPVVFLAFATAYPALLAGGLLLGLGGASFAVGVPFVSGWFPPERRGFALGVYGMGNIGTAISGFLTPRIADAFGRPWAFLVVAVGLAAVGLAFLLVGRDAPGRARATEPFLARFAAALRLRIARDLAVLYAITFGGFVAFGVYLPTFLKTVYGLSTTDAAGRAAGFVVLATVARPVGGWLSDRVSGVQVLEVALGVVAVGAVVTAFQPHIVPATVAFLSMAAALGLGNGAVFALVGKTVPAAQVGSVTGLVGAAGGLGGFLPPIVMGLVFQLGKPVAFPSMTSLPMTWEPLGMDGLFPRLDADIEVGPLGEDRTQLAISARYRPPLGVVGRAIDRVLLHRVAEATVKDFLDRVGRAITGRVAVAPRRGSA